MLSSLRTKETEIKIKHLEPLIDAIKRFSVSISLSAFVVEDGLSSRN